MGLKKEDYLILKKVANKNNYSLDELIKVYGKESSFGINLNRKGSSFHGPFQFGKDAIKDLKDEGYNFTLDDAKGNLQKSAEAYIILTNLNRKKYNRALEQFNVSSSGRKIINNLGESVKNYLIHQQGAQGLAAIAKSIESGTYSSERWFWKEGENLNIKGTGRQVIKGSDLRKKMLANLTDSQKTFFKDSTQTPSEASEYFLNSVKTQLDYIDYESDIKSYEKEINKKDDTSFLFPDDRVMNEALG